MTEAKFGVRKRSDGWYAGRLRDGRFEPVKGPFPTREQAYDAMISMAITARNRRGLR